MKNKWLILVALIILVFLSSITIVNAQAFMDFESGIVFTGYNDERIPGDEGTLFSLKTDLKAKPNTFVRIRAGYTIRRRHTISLLYAPLVVNSNGSSKKEINFNGVTFPSNTSLDARYQFNSYRITYRYDFVKKPEFEFGLGFTAKIRDAEIELNGQGLTASKKNTGFVPIINFRLNWKTNDKFGILLEGDALAAPQGRAEDVLLAGIYNFSPQLLLHLGYRILEGGADNDAVYSFALFHYASLGVTYTF